MAAVKILANLEKRGGKSLGVTGLVLILFVGALDVLTGDEISFSLFYLGPISLVTWFVGRNLGVFASILSALIWLVAEISGGRPYSNPIIYGWNSLIRLGFFIVVTLLLSELRKSLENERELSRGDFVTGAVSARFFYELVQMEINRVERYKRPFSIAYLDLDNFKLINDQFGHATGDHALRLVVKTLQRNLRKTDIVARLGGDEFAVLFPDTGAEVDKAIEKIQACLGETMRENSWPATVSIGVITYNGAPCRVDDLIKAADSLMYAVKSKGKDGVSYSSFPG